MSSVNYIGANINGYSITQFLGAGGMGEVYQAFHPTLNRKVAIKILFQADQTARFQNEAYIQSSIRHPNIAAMHEYTSYDGKPCIIMEFVDGLTLDKYLLRKGKLNIDELKQIFKQIITAIAHLHSLNIIHRDIKPSNLKITPEGIVKLLDFGISKAKYTPKLTQQGFLIGTTEYMAPEQFKQEVSSKTDIWALGVLFYELATGYLPFEDSNPITLRQRIEKAEFVNPTILNPNISQSINRIISQCLKQNTVQRPSANQILDELDDKKNISNLLNINDLIKKRWFQVGAGITILWIIFFSFSSNEEKTQDLTKKYIKIDVKDTNNAELVLPNGTVMRGEPFKLEKPTDAELKFQIRLGDFTKNYTIEANYPDSTFHCDLDVF